MSISDWTSVAAIDDKLVASILLNLKHSSHTSVSSSGGGVNSLPTFRWGRRKARSTHAVTTRFGMDKECMKRDTRSPTTPLSWSGSAASDDFEASSLGSPRFRSKTYVELKDEEESQLPERHMLKRDLATMHPKMDRHRNTNKKSKTIKRLKRMNNSNAVEASTLHDMSSMFSIHVLRYDNQQRAHTSASFDVDSAGKGRESFMLPDLNMLPSIDEEPFQQW